MRQPQGSAHLRTVFDQPYVSAAQPYVTACLLAVGLTPVKYKMKTPMQEIWNQRIYNQQNLVEVMGS